MLSGNGIIDVVGRLLAVRQIETVITVYKPALEPNVFACAWWAGGGCEPVLKTRHSLGAEALRTSKASLM